MTTYHIENGTEREYLEAMELKMMALGTMLIIGHALTLKLVYVDFILQSSAHAAQGAVAQLVMFVMVAALGVAAMVLTIQCMGWSAMQYSSILQERHDDEEFIGHELTFFTSLRAGHTKSKWLAECIYLLAHPQGQARLRRQGLENTAQAVEPPTPHRF